MPRIFPSPILVALSVALCATLCIWLAFPATAEAVVVSEIHYNPPADDGNLEFIEITAEFSGPEDLSGFAFVEGIRFTFPEGTILRGGESLVICADVDAVRARYGIENAIGNFDGRLDGSGERVVLVDHAGVVRQDIRYRDRGKWPVGPDGTGHTLVLSNLLLDPGEPESWKTSAELGGNPGRAGRPVQPTDTDLGELTPVVDTGEEWRFAKGLEPFSDPDDAWPTADFDDASWAVGASPFGYNKDGLQTVLDDMRGGYTAIALRKRFTLSQEELDALDEYLLSMRYEDGFCAFLNGSLVALTNCPRDVTWNSRARGSSSYDDTELFALPRDLLRPGENVLAVVGLNTIRVAGDFGILPRVVRRPLPQGQGVLVGAGDAWRFVKGTQPFSEPPDAWQEPDFDDASWLSGRSTFGPGVPGALTPLEDMPQGYTSVALRKTFMLNADDIETRGVILSIDVRHGFCAYVNGAAFARARCPQPATWDAAAERSSDNEGAQEFLLPPELLRAGDNVLALVAYDSAVGRGEFALTPRLLLEPLPQPAPQARSSAIVFNELLRAADGQSGWVELYNRSGESVDLSGLELTDSPDSDEVYRFAAGVMLPAGEFLVIDEETSGLALSEAVVQLFLLNADGIVLAAAAFDREPPPGVAPGGYTEALYPDGGRSGWVSTTATRGAANEVARVEDIVINEIFYHPPEQRRGEFLELYNRGVEPIDVSGFRFTKGIQFTFAEGTVIGAGEYFVLAEDPQLLRKHHGLTTGVAVYEGSLANGGENLRLVDAMGNLVDEVRYFDSGRWSLWADGRGGSLELIDPWHDNDIGSSWQASDEDDKAPWEEFSFTAEVGERPRWVLHLRLAERGACRVDDVSIVRVGQEENVLPNPGFEEGLAPWSPVGTHIYSEVVVGDGHTGEAALEIRADGRGNVRCNAVQVEPTLDLEPGTREVSLAARWLAGGSLLQLHNDFAGGAFVGSPLSGNDIAQAIRLTVPRNLGTPGAENSARLARRAETGSDNLGPSIRGVQHQPLSPLPGQPATVLAEIFDPDGVRSARVFYRDERGESLDFAVAELRREEDRADGYALYRGDLPAFEVITTVGFYVEAEDTLGNVERFPLDAPERVSLYPVVGPTMERAHILLSRRDKDELDTRILSSNALVDATFTCDENIYYNVGVRYRGSPWGRTAREGFRIRFGRDKPLLHGRKSINLGMRDRRDDAPGYFFEGRASTTEMPLLVPQYRFLSTRFDTQFFAGQNPEGPGIAGFFGPIDRTLVEQRHGSDAARDAVLLKANGRFLVKNCLFDSFDGADVRYRDQDLENYRFYWDHAVDQSEDDWQRFIDLVSFLELDRTDDEEFARRVSEFIDVEAFVGVLALRTMMGGGDALFIHAGHNGYIFFNPRTALWEYVLFDHGSAFQPDSISPEVPELFLAAEPRIARLLASPEPRRAYARFVEEFMEEHWSLEKSGPFLEALQEQVGLGGQDAIEQIERTRPAFEEAIRPYTNAAFRILTADGEDFAAPTSEIEIEGEAPVRVVSLVLSVNDAAPMPVPVEWTSATGWRARVVLSPGENRLRFIGADRAGQFVEAAEITVTFESGATFIRGDANGDEALNIADPIAMLGFIFRGEMLPCVDAADIDDNGTVAIDDVLGFLDFLLRGGSSPQPPFPQAGVDSTEDGLTCGTVGG